MLAIPRYDGGMSRMAVFLLFLALAGVGFAFFYRPRESTSRFGRLGQRVRTVAYAYVLAIIISAAMRWYFQWGI